MGLDRIGVKFITKKDGPIMIAMPINVTYTVETREKEESKGSMISNL